jgi:hypothetical protein
MPDAQLILWIDACERMLKWAHKNGRKGWKSSKAQAEAILESRRAKISAAD